MNPQLERLEGIIEAVQQGAAAGAAIRQKTRALQEQVVAGTYSTGDRVKDFLIVAYGAINEPELEAKIRSLSDLVEAHQGQQALLVGETYTKFGQDGCFGGASHLRTGRHLQLGVLEGSLDFDPKEKQLLLPSRKNVEFGSGFGGLYSDSSREEWKLQEGPLVIDNYRFVRPEEPMGDRYSTFHLLIGNEPVEHYFRLNYLYQENTFTVIEEKKWNKYSLISKERLDLSYVPALELLALEVPPDFRLAFDKQSEKRQTALFQEIYSLGEPARESPEAETLKKKLAYALEVGIHQKPLSLPGTRMGTTAFSNQVLPALCRHYEVEMPKEK